MNPSEQKHKYLVIGIVFLLAAVTRLHGTMPPYDDIYHLKRITAFPPLIELDRDRGENGAWCPWPPLYDSVMGAMPRVELVPVFGFAVFAAIVAGAIATRAGLVAAAIAGATLAISPYLIGVSHRGAIDHHWVEPALVVAILFATERRRVATLAIALTAAMFVQTALLVAAAIAFMIAWWQRATELWVSFAVPAVAIAAYRLTRPPSYPHTIWFLGWPHAAMFVCWSAAILAAGSPASTRRLVFAGVGLIALAPFLGTIAAGTNFFGGDPWLRTIVEFQPMFRDPARIGTDIANLTGGAFLAFTLWRRERTVAIFSIAYLLLALTSRRFLVPGIALFAIAGALASLRRPWVAALATLLPPLCYDAYAIAYREPPDRTTVAVATSVATLPPGRILAPWHVGHAIDVIGRHPVVIDGFGSMPDETIFANANDALLQRHADKLLAYMKERDIAYLVLTNAASGLPAAAAAVGIDPHLYAGTKLARSTVWWRLTHGETVPGFIECSKMRSNPSVLH